MSDQYPVERIKLIPGGVAALDRMREAKRRWLAAKQELEQATRELVAAERKLAIIEHKVAWPSSGAGGLRPHQHVTDPNDPRCAICGRLADDPVHRLEATNGDQDQD